MAAKTIWKWDDSREKLVCASAPITDEILGPFTNSFVRAAIVSLLLFEKIDVSNGFPRTKVEYYFQANLSGSIPKSFVNGSITNQLLHLSDIRNVFDRSLELDVAARFDFVKKIKDYVGIYSGEENEAIDSGLAMMKCFDQLPKITAVKTLSPLVSSSITYCGRQ